MAKPVVAGDSSSSSPLTALLEKQGFAILDGGLATALERRGHDLSQGGLWSARLLLDNPTAVKLL
jgi:homocysteine S-methyltransferase